jgi:hypothetical protein
MCAGSDHDKQPSVLPDVVCSGETNIACDRRPYSQFQERNREPLLDNTSTAYAETSSSSFWERVENRLRTRTLFYATLPAFCAILLMFCATAWQVFWPTTDPARYQCYALTFWFGSHATSLLPADQCAFLQHSGSMPPFHMLPIEYPPLTLLPFSVPLLFPLPYYQFGFALLMSVAVLITYWILFFHGPRGSALILLLYLLLGAFALVQMRFDLLPALCTLLCLLCAQRKQWTRAYIALSIGVLLKIYPLMFLPALFIAEQQEKGLLHRPSALRTWKQTGAELFTTAKGLRHWQWRNTILLLIVILGITGLFALSNFNTAVVSQIQYFLARPIQIETSGAVLLWFAHLAGMPWQIGYTSGSINITTASLSHIIAPLTSLAFLLGVLYVFWCQWRGQMNLTATVIALTFIFITTGKVFSPQYLIWVIPLLAYAGAFRRIWLILWGAISLLTTIIYTYFYAQLTDPAHIVIPAGFFETVLVRNGLFIFLTLAYLFNWFAIRTNTTTSPLSYPPFD